MESKWKQEMTVGVIFLAAMLVLGYYTIIMSRKFLEPPSAYRMTVVFPTVEGLEVGNKVKINGVEAGRVEEIRLRGHRVAVTLSMFISFTMYDDFSIKIKSDSLLGKKFVAVSPGTPMDPSGKPRAIVSERDNLPGKYEDVMGALSDLIEENRADIHASVRNLRMITEKINEGRGTIGKLINEDRVHAQTEELVKELRETIEDAREQAPITSFIRAALTAF